VGYVGRLDYPDTFQVNWLDIQMIEQADTLAKQQRCDIKMDFVHQAHVEALL
jgi:hypothetical protein